MRENQEQYSSRDLNEISGLSVGENFPQIHRVHGSFHPTNSPDFSFRPQYLHVLGLNPMPTLNNHCILL